MNLKAVTCFIASCCMCLCAKAELHVATFVCDVSPPVNLPVGLGFIHIAMSVEHPWFAKGVVLGDGNHRYVLCAIDWLEVHNESYDLLRATLASAFSTHSLR